MRLDRMKNERGVGLIEVLITVLVLATALLALAALQLRSLQFNHSAYVRSQANIMVYDIVDRMRLNRTNITAYNIGFEDEANDSGSIAGRDLLDWRANLTALVPSGKGSITCSAGRFCTVKIKWSEQDGTEEPDEEGSSSSIFTYTEQL